MATLDDVRAIAMSLPDVVEGPSGYHGTPGWKVRDKSFAWVRGLGPKDVRDLEALGERVPGGEIIALRVAAGDKEAVLASVEGVFHIPHFARYSGVLVELSRIDLDELRELLTEAWLVQAPKRLAAEFLASQGEGGSAGGE